MRLVGRSYGTRRESGSHLWIAAFSAAGSSPSSAAACKLLVATDSKEKLLEPRSSCCIGLFRQRIRNGIDDRDKSEVETDIETDSGRRLTDQGSTNAAARAARARPRCRFARKEGENATRSAAERESLLIARG
jgi:hypothetical protein